MASKLLFLLLLFHSSAPSLSDLLPGILPGIIPTIPLQLPDICSLTLDPAFCKSVLPHGLATLFASTRTSISISFSNAADLSITIDHHIATPKQPLNPTAARALQDCRLLADLNTDFLATANATLSATLTESETDDVHTLLSAVLTNQHTCSDGLSAADSAIFQELSQPLANGTKLYSLSLHLFVAAWRGPKKNRRNSFQSSTRTSEVVVGSNVAATAVVSKDGKANFTTIGDAIATAPEGTNETDGYFVIYVHAGVYEEHVNVPKEKRYVMMIGAGIGQTIITGNRSHGSGWPTFSSATFAVVGKGFVGIDMTIQNTAGAINHQAVALRSDSDESAFYRCSFESYQDTLYAHSLRQFYKDCEMYGTVDYIFGNAAVVFENCSMYSRLPLDGQASTVTAQGRVDPQQNTGISIRNCSIVAAADLAAAGNGSVSSARTFLGRPWKIYSRTVVAGSFIGGLVDPAGWLPWDGEFALATLFYAESGNWGPGSGTGLRVRWPGFHVFDDLSAVANFTISNFITGDSWLPRTGVPYEI